MGGRAGALPVPPGLAERLSRAPDAGRDGPGSPAGDFAGRNLLAAVGEAHRLIDADAAARRDTLTAQVRDAHDTERARAAAYYADAIAGIERRLATAPGDRRAVLEQRLRSTREEEARRLAEIAEKYEARHVIRPYRLHVIEVPALRVPADVRRGDRRYPMTFDWLLPAGLSPRYAARPAVATRRWWRASRNSAASGACPPGPGPPCRRRRPPRPGRHAR